MCWTKKGKQQNLLYDKTMCRIMKNFQTVFVQLLILVQFHKLIYYLEYIQEDERRKVWFLWKLIEPSLFCTHQIVWWRRKTFYNFAVCWISLSSKNVGWFFLKQNTFQITAVREIYLQNQQSFFQLKKIQLWSGIQSMPMKHNGTVCYWRQSE